MKKGNGHRHFDESVFSTNNQVLDKVCDTNLNTLKDMVDIQYNYLNLWHEYLNAQLDRLSTAKELSDVAAVESGVTTEFTNKFSEVNGRLYNCVWKAMEKQMEYYNLPVLPENYIPLFEGFEKTLTKNLKKRVNKASTVSA